MRLLSEHPAIVAHRLHPFESRSGSYWMHMLRVLSQPADFVHSAHPDNFQYNMFWVGHHPSHTPQLSSHPNTSRWLGGDYVEDLAGFCQRSIEAFYKQIASDQAQHAPAYFAEKYTPGHIPPLIWELYPAARELFLVRDFRDMFSSILAFNAKRGSAGFGRESVVTDEDHAKSLRFSAQRLLKSWRSRSEQARLVRYEDLVLSPEKTLAGVFEYVGLASDSAVVQGILQRASQDASEMRQHRTALSPAASVGRWKHDLSPALQAACTGAFGDILQEFGYEI